MNQSPAFRFRLHHLTDIALLILLITCSISCQKSSNSSSSNTSDTSNNGKGGNGALLKQEVVVVTNSSGATVDSIVASYQYNSNNLVTGMQQNSTYADSIDSLTTNLSYTVTWSGNLPSSLSGTFVETAQDGAFNESATIQINTTFQSSGGQIVSYIQRTSTTSGTVFFPPTQITGNDSALLTYDASGNLSTYNIYNIPNGSSTYEPFSFTTYTFGSGNLTQSGSMTNLELYNAVRLHKGGPNHILVADILRLLDRLRGLWAGTEARKRRPGNAISSRAKS